MYDLGEKMFYFRGGTHDFACATCHGDDGKRIRLQDLPNLTSKPKARRRPTRRGPRTASRRASCARSSGGSTTASGSSGFPSSCTGPTPSIALTTFLAHNANGAAFDAPAIKR